MILFIKHIDIEGPGTIADFLEDNKIPYMAVDLSSGDKLPQLKKAFQAVICLGGPMNVYEEEKYPFLKEEDNWLQKVVIEDVPFLGVCLGAQLIAKATGARGDKNPEKEIGWYKIVLSDAGLNDPLFKDFPEVFKVFQWHGDTFGIPARRQTAGFCRAVPESNAEIRTERLWHPVSRGDNEGDDYPVVRRLQRRTGIFKGHCLRQAKDA